MAFTDSEVKAWFDANPNASDKQIADAAKTAGISSSQLSRVTGESKANVEKRASAVGVNLGPPAGSSVKKTPPPAQVKKTPPPAQVKKTPPKKTPPKKTPPPASTPTDTDVKAWFDANPNATDKQIADAAKASNVTSDQLARVTGESKENVEKRAKSAGVYLRSDQPTGSPPKKTPPPPKKTPPPVSTVTTPSDADVLAWFNANPNATDKQIADAAKASNVSSDQLARVTGASKLDVEKRAASAGVTLRSDGPTGFPIGEAPPPPLQVEEPDYSSYSVDQLKQLLQDAGTNITADDVADFVIQYGIDPAKVAEVYNVTPESVQQAIDVRKAGGSAYSVTYTPVESDDTEEEVIEEEEVTVTDSSGNTLTFTYGSLVNDLIAEAYTNALETGDYSKVQQMLVNSGYTLSDVQNIFGLTDADMNHLQGLGLTGADPDDTVITGLYEEITNLLESNQDAQNEIDTLNKILSGLNLTIEDLQNKYALSQDDVDYIQSIGIGTGDGYNPFTGDMPTTETEIYERMTSPQLPERGRVVAEGIATDPSQFIGTDSGIGQVQTMRQATGVSQPGVTTAGAPTQIPTSTMQAAQTSADIANALQDVNPAAGSVSENAQMQAITQSPTSTDVGTVGPAQLTETTQVQAPQSRTLQSGEMIQSAVDREKAMAFVDQAQAATADPSAKATVQGQLADIMSQFDGGQIPAWAAGAMRTANATLASRGLGASSLAGQAVVQAAMEASLPIAIQDAATQAQFEQQNLSNRQQRAMLSAQQRAAFMQQEFDQEFQARVANAAKISDIANMNFNAEQQIALENARLAQTVELANLSNRQAMVMAETAQIAQLELSNLNNRQQAAVQNANAFLQMDMTNLSNEQQMTMFDAQSRVNAIFSDAAAENAARQFNSQSENQTNQFFQSLATQVQQFNANQLNSMEQFRVEQVNTLERFNAQLATQQDQFNAENQLVIAQSDAQWNRQIATADTAAQNMANQLNAQSIMEMSNQAFANAAQILRDQMEFSFDAGQSQADRDAEIVLQLLANEGAAKVAELRSDDDGVFGNVIGRVVGKVLGF